MFPLDVNDYELIEDRLNVNVNVSGIENKVYPVYVLKNTYD